ncbi:hypothetical protein WA026_012587 [Henosepilachna vigintioctopunctata]|uniref:Uncharacterized protein n=1 Tax=Henosepilachna vigintioctopunctata TaxID=420089 RepID=A0AAW1U832_9CUCU
MENGTYHPDCYGKIVVLKAKYKEEYNMMLRREGSSPSTSRSNNDPEERSHNEEERAESSQKEEEKEDYEEEGETVKKEPRIFCNRYRKKAASKMVGTSLCTTKDIIDNVREYARVIGAEQLEEKFILSGSEWVQFVHTAKFMKKSVPTCYHRLRRGT